MKNNSWVRVLLCLGIFAFASVPAYAQVNHDETVDGELSGDNLAPFDLGVFGVGLNNVAGTIVDARGANPNVDVFTFDIAAGTQLDGIFLNQFDSTDNVAFLGIDDSNTFPFNTAELDNSPDQSQFIGGLLFGGSSSADNIIDPIGSGFGAGFSGPLGAGEYTVYLQQLGGATVDYSLGFSVVSTVPEPATGLLLAPLFGMAAMRRRRSQ